MLENRFFSEGGGVTEPSLNYKHWFSGTTYFFQNLVSLNEQIHKVFSCPGKIQDAWLLFRPTFLSVRNSCVVVFYDLLKTDEGWLKLTKLTENWLNIDWNRLKSAKASKSQQPKRTHKTKKSHEHQRVFWTPRGGYQSLPSKTRVLKQIAPESSPERSAKFLSHSFFVVPFLPRKRTREKRLKF